MDHNLEDSLTMESIDIDFDHSGAVVNQDDITLEDGSQVTHIPMDLDTIEGQSTLLEPNNEEVIVSDFIGDQFGFQDYSMEGENSSGANITIEGNQLREALTGTNEQTIDLQYADCVSTPTTSKSNVITIKAVAQQRGPKKVLTSTLTYPREIAIAPKPIKGPSKPIKGAPNVQYAIAPKPVALMVNKNANLTKTITMKNVVQNINKGNTVLAQVGKQLVMLPGGKAGQKIKLSNLLPTGSTDAGKQIQIVRCSPESAQLIANKGGKQIRTKFIVQGQSNIDSSNQPAVITKMVPVNTASQARYVMQQKTVPISIGGNKVVLTTPPKQGVKVAPKKQIISIKSQSPKVVTSLGNVQTKRVVITANQPQTQNVIVKAAGTKTSAQVAKDNTVQQQRTQLHPINVPGKGIQFIKLVTNQPKTASGGAVQKATLKPHTLTMSGKNFVLTDSLGKIIQMTAEKAISSQPPPLHLSSSTTSNTVTTRAPTKKLVRIAPVNKGITTTAPRAPQSLLIESKSPVLSGTSVSIEEFNEMVDQNNLVSFGTLSGEETIQQAIQEETLLEEETNQIELSTIDVKPTLASLISDAVSGEVDHEIQHMEEVEIEYDNTTHKHERYTEEENTNSMQHDDSSNEKPNENLIIVPAILPDNSSRLHNEHMYHDQTNTSMEDSRDISNTSMKTSSKDIMSYLTPQIDQSYPDSVYNMYEGNTDDPGLRPRKACNCTKSQCLKLYCDCFANGEFCNKCNCNNCHNNLENEELRQKAIRGCLERNPNAFRPKIGKAKSGGPEIIRRHNKGCNCKRSGCLKNYCECYEAKIACTMMCKCVGCRNVEETLERRREQPPDPAYRPPLPSGEITISRQPCSFMTPEVIEAVAQCMLATATEPGDETDRDRSRSDHTDPIEDILLEFSRCMADIINASHQQL